MTFKECVYSVLIVSASGKFNSYMSSILPECDFYPVDTVGNISEAKRKVLERTYDIIVINSPLPDDQGIIFATEVSENSETGVLLFVKNDIYEGITAKVMELGILTLSKPTSPSFILQSIHLLCAVHEKIKCVRKESASLKDKMEEIRTVNHAKWLLIEFLKMSEEEAHRYIEKQAMNERCSKKQIAERIIRTYR